MGREGLRYASLAPHPKRLVTVIGTERTDRDRPRTGIRWVFWFLTTGLVFLGGVIIPADDNRDGAGQAGFDFTHVKNRNEIDIDALYQAGSNNRSDSGRYDISWQYRLSPTERSDWGITQELNSVLELNSRWNEGKNTIPPIINPKNNLEKTTLGIVLHLSITWN